MPLNLLKMPINMLCVATIAAVAGCSEPAGPRTVHNRDLAVKVPAIKEAVDHKDQSAAPQLVKDLDSDDPAVRFYAIEGLKRLTGQTFGYVYYADADRRREAVMRWRRWLDDSQREAGK
jgi:hypothetical protein